MTDPHHTGKQDRTRPTRKAPRMPSGMEEHPQRWTVNPIEHVQEERQQRQRSGGGGRGGSARTRVRNPVTPKQMRAGRPKRVRAGARSTSRPESSSRTASGGRERRMIQRTSERQRAGVKRKVHHRQNAGGILGGRRSVRGR
jgi:hypothetical protein